LRDIDQLAITAHNNQIKIISSVPTYVRRLMTRCMAIVFDPIITGGGVKFIAMVESE